MKIFFFVIVYFAFLYTPPYPGDVHTQKSEIAGSTITFIEPARLANSRISLALYTTSNMPPGQIVLVAIVEGDVIISEGNSLTFYVDKRPYSLIATNESFESMEQVGTYVNSLNQTRKHFLTDCAFIQNILKADSVVVKIQLSQGFMEAVFSKNLYPLAKPAFTKFYEQVCRSNMR